MSPISLLSPPVQIARDQRGRWFKLRRMFLFLGYKAMLVLAVPVLNRVPALVPDVGILSLGRFAEVYSFQLHGCRETSLSGLPVAHK